MGMPRCAAVRPASSMESTVRELSVPMFRHSPAATPDISATSWMSSAITGEAPQASSILATSDTVT